MMNNKWWIMDDEWWMMNGEWWMMNDESEIDLQLKHSFVETYAFVTNTGWVIILLMLLSVTTCHPCWVNNNWRVMNKKLIGKGKDQDTAKDFKDWAVFFIWKPAKYETAVTLTLPLPIILPLTLTQL